MEPVLNRGRFALCLDADHHGSTPLETRASRRTLPVDDWVLAEITAHLNPKVIQSRLGHATIAETMDIYGHLFPDSEDLGRGAVETALAGALAEQERNISAQCLRRRRPGQG